MSAAELKIFQEQLLLSLRAVNDAAAGRAGEGAPSPSAVHHHRQVVGGSSSSGVSLGPFTVHGVQISASVLSLHPSVWALSCWRQAAGAARCHTCATVPSASRTGGSTGSHAHVRWKPRHERAGPHSGASRKTESRLATPDARRVSSVAFPLRSRPLTVSMVAS